MSRFLQQLVSLRVLTSNVPELLSVRLRHIDLGEKRIKQLATAQLEKKSSGLSCLAQQFMLEQLFSMLIAL